MSRIYITFETRFFRNVFSGEYFVKSNIVAHLLIHFIAIASMYMYVSCHAKLQGTTYFWNERPLTITAISFRQRTEYKLCWTEMKGNVHVFGSLAEVWKDNCIIQNLGCCSDGSRFFTHHAFCVFINFAAPWPIVSRYFSNQQKKNTHYVYFRQFYCTLHNLLHARF